MRRSPANPASTDVVQVAAKLLRDGLVALDHDGATARTALLRAVSLLEAECNVTDQAKRGISEYGSGSLSPWQIRRVVSHVDANLDAPLSIAELAALTRLSGNYFSRAFKRSFGVTPRAYVMRKRIERAQHMMLCCEDSLANIAFSCGFADHAHFTRSFRRALGAPPQAWRRHYAVPYAA